MVEKNKSRQDDVCHWESVMAEPIMYVDNIKGRADQQGKKIRQGTLRPVTRLCRKPL
jgi:hypothetical protein